jgi:hypothetical protein
MKTMVFRWIRSCLKRHASARGQFPRSGGEATATRAGANAVTNVQDSKPLSTTDLSAFLRCFSKEQKQQTLNRKRAPQFNVFQMLNVETRETDFHSKILADLLSPAGSHGQGAVFLSEFLKMLVENGWLVATEPDGQGYYVDLEKDKIDINIYKPNVCFIGIENKINAIEQPD